MSKARWQDHNPSGGFPQERWRLWLAISLIMAAYCVGGQAQAAAEASGAGGLGDQMLTALTQSRRESSSNPDLDSNGDAWTVKAGETVVLAREGSNRRLVPPDTPDWDGQGMFFDA